MDEETLRILGYFDITDELSRLCITSGGKDFAHRLKPLETYDEALLELKETTEAKFFYDKEGDLPFVEFVDVEPILDSIRVLSIVRGEELLRIASFINTLIEIKDIGESFSDQLSLLRNYTSRISALPEIAEKIYHSIEPDGTVKDDASPLLSIIRREIKISYGRIQTILQSFIYSKDYEDVIQDPIITKRNGRYVIPIRQNVRPAFQYIVQGESSTRLTVFAEPISVVELNNKLVDLASKEKAEEERIILEIEELIASKMGSISSSLGEVYKLDFIFAKAKLSSKLKGEEPELATDCEIYLAEARHPFIPEEVVVPINVEVGKNFRMLVITGPNTGGKTVTLKTIGLLTLMAMSGLHIPAYSSSKIGFFSKVFADIGDEQSIQQSLSTFSSHMRKIINILNNADNRSLVLIDELGAGTDPEEGSALGYAILKKLYEIEATTVVSTHHSKLKEFPYKFKLSQNAAVGFDTETLAPTYHLYIGIPGESHAFVIAKNLGLADDILNEAESQLSEDFVESKEIISRMSQEQKKIGESREIIEKNREEAEELKKTLEKKVQDIDDRKRVEVKKAYDEARRIVDETKKTMNEILENLDNAIKSQKVIQELKKTFTEESQKIEEAIEQSEPKENVDMGEIQEGTLVYVPHFNKQGIVLSKLEDKGKLVIQMGSIRASVSINDVKAISNATYTPPVQKDEEKSEILKEISNLQVPMKIDLHGLTAEEAIEKLDKYLDSAYLVGMPFVYVVHGKGSGALREAVINYLRAKEHVSHFYIGTPEEGGSGVTIVYLK
ncbi:MAG: endonuclease MutS2 [Caldisericaceae bacterium]